MARLNGYASPIVLGTAGPVARSLGRAGARVAALDHDPWEQARASRFRTGTMMTPPGRKPPGGSRRESIGGPRRDAAYVGFIRPGVPAVSRREEDESAGT
jgi:hypothetical protein